VGTSGFVAVEGTRLYYEVAGTGQPVVLLHGGMLDLRQWDEQFDILAREFRVVRYDARGYGRSALGTAPYSHHEDLAALLRALDVEWPHLVALSNGAAIAVEFAIWAPASVRSLVVGAAPMRGHDLGPEFMAGIRAILVAGAGGEKDACRTAVWDFEPLGVAAGLPDVRRRIDQMIVEEHEFAYARPGAPARGFLEPPVSVRFAEITAPTLILVGNGEMRVLIEQGQAMARTIPGAQLKMIEGAGHVVNMEQPAAFVSVVLEWLRAH
jgi:pimeloyl-ACP methyl ester carboxylesterase